MKEVQQFAQQTFPAQSITDALITQTESGVSQLTLEAPQIVMFNAPNERTVYPKGIFLKVHGSHDSLKATIQAGYAISIESKHLMEARDSVVVIDYSTGDTSYLQHIVWNTNKGIIYSNHPVRSVNGSRVTYGDGFLSDENFTDPQIVRQRGTIEWNDQ
ncbi:MAG: hypothetical protein IJV22_01415 [Bacteroidales bacterium]|nr:hypothetical protein [Bacteroidales bacterium]